MAGRGGGQPALPPPRSVTSGVWVAGHPHSLYVGRVSFDIFFLSFRSGRTAPADRELLDRLLRPHLADTGHGFPQLHFGNGEAAIYGTDRLQDGFMVNRVVHTVEAWDVLWAVAREGGLVIFPVGCPVAVPREDLVDELPEVLRDEAVVVQSGRDLMRLIET